MPKSWVTLIIISVLILLFITGVQIYDSLTGGTQKADYAVDDIRPDLGKQVLDHLEESNKVSQ